MDVISKDELILIAHRRMVMGGYITYASEISKPAFTVAFDDSERLQKVLTSLQSEVIELRERVQTQSDMISELINEGR